MFEQQTSPIEELRAAKRCVACGAERAGHIRPPCVHGVALEPTFVVAACESCMRLVRRATDARYFMLRRTALLLPVLLPLAGSFVLPTQGVLSVRGPLVIAGVFLATWIALLVAVARFRRRAAASPLVVVAVRDGMIDLQLPSPEPKPAPAPPDGAGPYRAPSEKPAAKPVRPKPPTDRLAGAFVSFAFVFTAIATWFAWNQLYAEVIVSNHRGADCDVSVDGSHVQVQSGTQTMHVRAGRRRIVVMCVKDRNYPEHLFQVQIGSDDTVHLQVDKLGEGKGLEVSRNHGPRSVPYQVRMKPGLF